MRELYEKNEKVKTILILSKYDLLHDLFLVMFPLVRVFLFLRLEFKLDSQKPDLEKEDIKITFSINSPS